MSRLRYTLISDGSSDRMLLPVLDWLLMQHSEEVFVPQWADLSRLPRPPKGLRERLSVGLDQYPCELLFVHRDAEEKDWSVRQDEIQAALDGLETPPVVCIVPVRMLEAWFLFNAQALRRAAGNPEGRGALSLPSLKDLNPRSLVYQVANLIDDFAPLRALEAFRALERSLVTELKARGWA